MAKQTIDDLSLVEALLDVFRVHGFEGATINLISEMTGLQKSSLYHRFPTGKEEMVNAVVMHVHKQLNEFIIEPLLNTKISPEKRFTNMITAINGAYGNGTKNCIWNVLHLGEIKLVIKQKLKDDFNDWLSALIKLGKELGMSKKEAEQKSKHFLTIVEGSLVIQRITGDSNTFKTSLEYEKKLFFNS